MRKNIKNTFTKTICTLLAVITAIPSNSLSMLVYAQESLVKNPAISEFIVLDPEEESCDSQDDYCYEQDGSICYDTELSSVSDNNADTLTEEAADSSNDIWTCNNCMHSYALDALSSKAFEGVRYPRFTEPDEAGAYYAYYHTQWCTSKHPATWYCDLCSKTFHYDYNSIINWDTNKYVSPKSTQKLVGEDQTAIMHYSAEACERVIPTILEECINNDMSDLEKAWYLFIWCRDNIEYDHRDAGYGRYYCMESNYKSDPLPGSEEFKKKYFILNGKVYKYIDYTERQKAVIADDGCIYTQSGYGALVQRTAVCGGISAGYMMLLQAANIDVMRKMSLNWNHAWNIVKLDGSWYCIDPTQRRFAISEAANPYSNYKDFSIEKHRGFSYLASAIGCYPDIAMDNETYIPCVDTRFDGLNGRSNNLDGYYYTLYNQHCPGYNKDSSSSSSSHSSENEYKDKNYVYYDIDISAGKKHASGGVYFDNKNGELTGEHIKKTKYGYQLTKCIHKKGYTFAGWFNGNKRISKITVKNFKNNAVLKAKWIMNKYTISFIPKSPQKEIKVTGKRPGKKTVLYSNTVTLPNTVFSADGYVQIGWTDGTNTYELGEKVSELTDKANKTIKLYPIWEEE